jgi:prepilin-type N-terminal cleavage/methylation domain-containing protein
MSVSTNIKGFTLVELLIALGIIAGLSVAATALLWDMITVQSRQAAATTGNHQAQLLVHTLSKHVQAARTVSVPNAHTLELRGTDCITYRYIPINQHLERATFVCGSSPVFETIHPASMKITTFALSPVMPQTSLVNLTLSGQVEDTVTTHPFSIHTTVTKRSNL